MNTPHQTPSPAAKPTLVMIHGFRGTHHGLLLIAKQLRGFNIIIPDLPGFGNGPHLKEYSLEQYVEWLHGFITKQAAAPTTRQARTPGPAGPLVPAPKPFLLGHSFGSIVCAAYAKKYPGSIQKLILVNPIGAPALEGPKKALTQLAILYYRIGTKLPEKAAHKWLASKTVVQITSLAMVKTHDKPLRSFIHQQHQLYFSRFHNRQSLLESFQTSVSHNVGDFAAGIPVPTLLIAGSLDDITPLSAQYALVKKFPHATLKVIDNVGHLTHYETPGEVARLVQGFSKTR